MAATGTPRRSWCGRRARCVVVVRQVWRCGSLTYRRNAASRLEGHTRARLGGSVLDASTLDILMTDEHDSLKRSCVCDMMMMGGMAITGLLLLVLIVLGIPARIKYLRSERAR